MPNYILRGGQWVAVSLTPDELSAGIQSLMGGLPIATYARASDFGKPTITFDATAKTWKVAEDCTGLLGGISGVITAYTSPALTTTPTKTFLYMVINQGQFSYSVLDAAVQEDYDKMYIASADPTTGVLDISDLPITRFGIYRLSTNPVGSAIPVSIGEPTQYGSYTFNW